MELHCIHSPAVNIIPRNGLLEKSFSYGFGYTAVKVIGNKRSAPDSRRIRHLDWRCRTAGTSIIKSQVNGIAATSGSDIKDQNLVFVAGATGKVGSRTVRELLKLGFGVRAGVRSVQRAQSLVQSVKNMKLEDLVGDIDKFELVECDLERPDQITPALGNSSIVICCIGASEKEIFDVTGPYRIDYQATKNLIDAATYAKVDHFILLTSLGTNKVGFPAAILNLFWGVLVWKRKAEEALFASGLPYTIVRPGGMERPTDAYKETHNITLSNEDTLFGGQVSNLQVAELIASIAKNRGLSYCKVLEVVAETTAPLTPLEDLLKKIPSKREQIYPFKKEPDETAVVSEITLEEKEREQIKATSAKKPLSPYACYEDLKPPTSPTPTPSTGINGTTKQTASAAVVSTTSSLEVVSPEKLSVAVESETPPTEVKQTQPSSPYIRYHDLKPPSSPSPSVPNLAVNAKAGTPVLEKTGNVNHYIPTNKTTPLSPYTMYEDLKPPSSPVPSPRK